MCVLHTGKVEVVLITTIAVSTWMIAPLLFAQASQSAIDHHVCMV
jgi:hypothetical protein